MRTSRRIQLAGLVALAGAGAAPQAAADDLTISNTRTDPVFTATAAGAPLSPGNVTVNTGAGITIDGVGEAAITVNSNNNVTNSGVLASTNVNNTGGILIEDGFAGTITNNGQLNFTDGYVLTDTDNDGDLDGEFATGSGRYGIMLNGGTFTGNIIANGSIQVEGNGSYGIRINGLLDGNGTTTGNLTSDSVITVIGDNSIAVSIDGGLTGGVVGDVIVRSGLNALGEGARGLVVNAPVGGELRLNGNWTVTGYHHTAFAPDRALDPGDDDLIGGPAASVHFSVDEGVTIEGIGQVDDDDDDGDGENDETDDNRTATISSYGTAPALWIANQSAVDLVLGATSAPGGYGLHNLGSIGASGAYNGFDSTAVRIESLTGNNVTTAAGFNNEGSISARAYEANATALYIGANASVPTINNIGGVTASSTTEGADVVHAILIGSTATDVGTLNNIGGIGATILGEQGDAVAIRDLSGTLTAINNTGTIRANIIVTDDDLTDGVTPTVTGSTIALDLSAAGSSVFINQNENSDTSVAELIQGDILLGIHDDFINLNAGSIRGAISFGDGSDFLNINNGASYRGALSDSDNDLTINVTSGTLHADGGAVTIADANFGAGSTLVVTMTGDDSDPPVINALGTVTFDAGAAVRPFVPTGLVEAEQEFLTAASLVGGSNVTGVVSGAGTPFVYNLEISLTNPLALDGAANGLTASYTLKDAAQLGLTANQAAAFDPMIAALQQDSRAGAAFVALDTESAFFEAYQDMMPNYASAAAEVAATAILQAQSATSNRLSATRLHNLNDVSVWAQEIGYGLNREPPTANGLEFRGHGFGLAAGIDGPLNNGALFGISASFLASEVEEPRRPDGEISASIGQLNAYLGSAMGPLDFDLIGGLGAGKMESRRFVAIGDSFAALSEADWWAFEGHGSARVSAPMTAGWLVMTPQAALTYVFLSEQGYTEEGGGAAVDLEVDDATSQRLWGDAGVEFALHMRRGNSIIAPRVFLGYRANLLDEEAERTYRFVSGDTPFTLTDESLGDGGPLVGIGLDATNGYSTIALGYEGEFGDQIERHSLNISVRFKF